ncbi:MAG TPA: aconitate hydratase AcnA [Nakamurella sp.]
MSAMPPTITRDRPRPDGAGFVEPQSQVVTLAGRRVGIHCVPALATRAGIDLDLVPFAGRVLIESLLRAGDEASAITLARRLAAGRPADLEMNFRPARLLVQDYTGIPLLIDLAAVRDAVVADGGRPELVNPAVPTDVVVDHSVQVDVAGRPDARARNESLELSRNGERYAFLRWAEQAFDNLRVFPPGAGIVHQINIERLSTVVRCEPGPVGPVGYPDTVLGTDSHTTMVNGLGVLGWGVGGLEAAAVMLGLAHPIAVPRIVGVRLVGAARPGICATDLVLALTAHLRPQDVGGALLEFTGPAVAGLSAADRCTIANMAPEYGAMAAFFPVDAETLRYLTNTGRASDHVEFVAAYCRRQRTLNGPDAPEPRFSRVIDFDLGSVEATLAGPSHPHQRVSLDALAASLNQALTDTGRGPARTDTRPHTTRGGAPGSVVDGDVVIAAITSCTSTSNPRAMLAAGLLAHRAVERGLAVPAHVKTSFAPGSPSVARYLRDAGWLAALETLGFHVVGFGCTTCNGGSGPLAPHVAESIDRHDLAVCAVLSGNRNFAGRIHPQVKANYLASPALVVALAIKGHVRGDLRSEPLGLDRAGAPVHLADIWPDDAELARAERRCVHPGMFAAAEPGVTGWAGIAAQTGPIHRWQPESTYIRRPPHPELGAVYDTEHDAIRGARVLVLLGDSISTDHISPVGSIAAASPAGRHLLALGVRRGGLNSYGSRRGDHEVMVRGTFANPRLLNHLVSGEGGDTVHLPTRERLPIFDAASRYRATGTPLIVLAGNGYGMGSSRDWAAKGQRLLGVVAVLAESFERIHRANLCAMGVLPVKLPRGWRDLGLTGREEFDIEGLRTMRESRQVVVTARPERGSGVIRVPAQVDIRSDGEWELLGHGGMLPYLKSRLGVR